MIDIIFEVLVLLIKFIYECICFLFFNNPLSIFAFVFTVACGYGWKFKTIWNIKRNYPDEKILFIYHSPIILYVLLISFFIDINFYEVILSLMNYMNYSLIQNIYTIVSLLGFCFLFLILIIGIFSIQILTNKRIISKELLNIKNSDKKIFIKKNILINSILNCNYKLNRISTYTIGISIKDNTNIYFKTFFEKPAKEFCYILNNLLEDNKEEIINV